MGLTHSQVEQAIQVPGSPAVWWLHPTPARNNEGEEEKEEGKRVTVVTKGSRETETVKSRNQ